MLAMKTTCEIKKKKTLDGINRRLDMGEEVINGLKDMAIETTQN